METVNRIIRERARFLPPGYQPGGQRDTGGENGIQCWDECLLPPPIPGPSTGRLRSAVWLWGCGRRGGGGGGPAGRPASQVRRRGTWPSALAQRSPRGADGPLMDVGLRRCGGTALPCPPSEPTDRVGRCPQSSPKSLKVGAGRLEGPWDLRTSGCQGIISKGPGGAGPPTPAQQ